jgi:large subunit ribosomal protein L27
MAHTKQQGAANRHIRRPGKRLGVKKFGSESVKAGNIIVKQKGTKFHSGKNTGIGKDFTIFATTEGVLNFKKMTGIHRGQSIIEVLPKDKPKVSSEKKTK